MTPPIFPMILFHRKTTVLNLTKESYWLNFKRIVFIKKVIMLLKVCKIASKTITLEKDNSYLREQHPKVATLLPFLHSFSLLLRHPDRVNRFCYLYFPPHISTEMGLCYLFWLLPLASSHTCIHLMSQESNRTGEYSIAENGALTLKEII